MEARAHNSASCAHNSAHCHLSSRRTPDKSGYPRQPSPSFRHRAAAGRLYAASLSRVISRLAFFSVLGSVSHPSTHFSPSSAANWHRAVPGNWWIVCPHENGNWAHAAPFREVLERMAERRSSSCEEKHGGRCSDIARPDKLRLITPLRGFPAPPIVNLYYALG